MKPIRILILFYSLTGATAQLARCVAAGAKQLSNCTVVIKRVPEVMPPTFFSDKPPLQQKQQQLEREFPLASLDDLISADGIAFGTPVHFGSFASQLKQFLDQLSPVWLEGRMVNKPAAVFCSAGSLHGGEELTLVSLMIPLLNLGMLPVGLPYSKTGGSASFDSASPYGAIFVTGKDGKNPLTDDHRHAAELLGQRLARLTRTLQCGCDSCGCAI